MLPTLEETRRILFGEESASMEASAGAKENKDYHGQQERLNALLTQGAEDADEEDRPKNKKAKMKKKAKKAKKGKEEL